MENTEFNHDENQNKFIPIVEKIPSLTLYTHEESDEELDKESVEEADDDSMPELVYCTGCADCCWNYGIENKNIQPEQPIDYNDEEIEKREERYENWKKNKQIRFLTLDSPLLKEIEEEKN